MPKPVLSRVLSLNEYRIYPRSAIAVSAKKKLRKYKDFPRHSSPINNVI